MRPRIAAILLACAATPAAFPANAPRAPAKGSPQWLSLDKGLEAARPARGPLLVWYPGGEPAAGDRSAIDAYLEDSHFRRVASRFILVRLSDADLEAPYPAAPPPPGAPPPLPVDAAPPTVGEKLRIVRSIPALLLLDHRERIVRRSDGLEEVPERPALARELARTSARSRRHAEQESELRRIFDASLAAFRQGKLREAVLAMLPYDPPAGREALDPALRAEAESIIDDYRKQAELIIDRAESLVEDARLRPQNSAKKFADAIKAYDELIRDYPFPDFVARATREKNEILTHIPGPLPLPGAR